MRRLLTGAVCLVVATTAIVVGVSSTAWAAAENQIITFSHRCTVINDDARTEGVICADIQFRLTTSSVQARSAGQGVCQDWGGGTTRQCRGISYDVGLFRDSDNATQLTSANGRCGYFGGSACPASGRLIVYTPWYTIGSKPPPGFCLFLVFADLWTSVRNNSFRFLTSSGTFSGPNVASAHADTICRASNGTWSVS